MYPASQIGTISLKASLGAVSLASWGGTHLSLVFPVREHCTTGPTTCRCFGGEKDAHGLRQTLKESSVEGSLLLPKHCV